MIGNVLRSQSWGRVQRLVGARFLKPAEQPRAPGDPWDSELSDQNVGFRPRRLMGREFLKPGLPRLTEKPHLVPRGVLGHRASRNANSIGGPEADGGSRFQLVGLWWGWGRGSLSSEARATGTSLGQPSIQPRSQLVHLTWIAFSSL